MFFLAPNAKPHKQLGKPSVPCKSRPWTCGVPEHCLRPQDAAMALWGRGMMLALLVFALAAVAPGANGVRGLSCIHALGSC
jgi:hypothetical protein